MAMASTRAVASDAAALARLFSRAVAVPRAAGQRRFGSCMFASAASKRATMGVGAWRNTGLVERRWKSDGLGKTEREKAPEPEEEKNKGLLKREVGFDEVNSIVALAAPSRLRMRQYLADQSQPLLIDVRSPAEYAAGSIPSAVNLPVNSHMDALFASPEDFEDRVGFPRPDEHRKLVFYCKAGVRSHAAAEIAVLAGFANVNEYKGSWLDWEGRGGEVVQGQDVLKDE